MTVRLFKRGPMRGVDPGVDIDNSILQQITDAGRPPLDLSIPAQAGRDCGKMNDNCIEAMVFGEVLDADGQAALGLGHNLDMWVRQDPNHADTFPWGTQQWNGVSGSTGEFLSFQNDGPDCGYDQSLGATSTTGCGINGYSACNPGDSRHNPSGHTYTYCDYSSPDLRNVQTRTHLQVFFLEAGSTATDAADINNWVTIPFMAFTIYDFDHDGMNAGYEHMCIRDTDSYGNALDGYFFAGSKVEVNRQSGQTITCTGGTTFHDTGAGTGKDNPKITSTLTTDQKAKSVAVWLQNFKVFEFETEITLPVSRGRNFIVGGAPLDLILRRVHCRRRRRPSRRRPCRRRHRRPRPSPPPPSPSPPPPSPSPPPPGPQPPPPPAPPCAFKCYGCNNKLTYRYAGYPLTNTNPANPNFGKHFHRDDDPSTASTNTATLYTDDFVYNAEGGIAYGGAICLKIAKVLHDRGHLAYTFDGEDWDTVHQWTEMEASPATAAEGNAILSKFPDLNGRRLKTEYREQLRKKSEVYLPNVEDLLDSNETSFVPMSSPEPQATHTTEKNWKKNAEMIPELKPYKYEGKIDAAFKASSSTRTAGDGLPDSG